jgi:hypothetical protein
MTDIKVLNRYLILFITFAIILSGCSDPKGYADGENDPAEHEAQENRNTNLPLDQFVKWVADKENKLIKDKAITDINYQLAYMPQELLAYTELKNEDFSKERFEEVKKNYAGMTYFKFRIEIKNGSGELLKYNLQSAQQYNERISYMSFKMQKDIFLVQANDTIYPDLFHFERIFDVAPYATVMFAFDDAKFKSGDEFTIIYNDRLFDKGIIKYNYKSKQLIDLPNIKGV